MGLANRMLSKTAWSIAALSIAGLGFATPLRAETSDAAYCAQLTTLAMRYTGSATAGGGNRPDPMAMWAIEHCKDNPAVAIPVLEMTLRNSRVPLPSR